MKKRFIKRRYRWPVLTKREVWDQLTNFKIKNWKRSRLKMKWRLKFKSKIQQFFCKVIMNLKKTSLWLLLIKILIHQVQILMVCQRFRSFNLFLISIRNRKIRSSLAEVLFLIIMKLVNFYKNLFRILLFL